MLFATSIDHVCNLEQTFRETYRILDEGGTMVLWHDYNHNPLRHFARHVYRSIKYGYNDFRYAVYHDEHVVFSIPKGAVDPFHKEYIPTTKLTKLAKQMGFTVQDITAYDKSTYFITYKKS